MNDAEIEYWKKYYDDDSIIAVGNSQKNVGRTVQGKPISDELWAKTIDFIKDNSAIDSSSTVLELCCGNGEVVGNLARACKTAIGVDYSKKLLEQMEERFGDKVKAIYADALEADFEETSLDVVIIYASIQYFDEKDTLKIVENSLKWLKPGGRLFIGDIPNELKKWDYVNKPEYRHDYLKRAAEDRPMIGVWFQPKFFEAMADYFEGITVKILEQPEYQNNATYRYDALITKG